MPSKHSKPRPNKPDPGARFRPAAAAEPKSALAQRIEARGPRWRIFAVSNLFGLGGKELEHVGVMLGRGRDSEAALLSAHKHAADRARELSAEGAAGDRDLLTDAKVREILYRLTRAVDPTDPTKLKTTADGAHTYAAFPSPNWMRENLGTDELAALMHLVGEVRRLEAPRPAWAEPGADPFGLDDDNVEAWATLLADVDDTAPAAQLAPCPRDFVAALCVRLAQRLDEAARARDALLEQGDQAVDALQHPAALES